MAFDPDARNLIELVKASGRPPIDTMTPAEAREAYQRASQLFSPDRPEMAELRDLAAEGPDGPIGLRLYRGKGAPVEAAAALVYLHGGGWTIGDLDTHDYVCRKFANDARCVVISVDYRLAPEHKHPKPLEDCIAAARWIAANAGALGIDAGKLAIGGDSAGGNLSAVLTLIAREGGAPKFVFQMLLYPAVDATMRHASYKTIPDDVPLTEKTTRYFLDHYINGEADKLDWRVSPLRAGSFENLPPAFVLTARHDPLCDEGRDYAQALEKAGVRVWSVDLNDQVHGFLTNGKMIRAADMALDMASAALRYGFLIA